MTYYEALGVDDTATTEEIERAFRSGDLCQEMRNSRLVGSAPAPKK